MMYLEVGKVLLILGGIAALAPFGLRVAAGAVGFAFGANAILGIYLVIRENPAQGPSPRRLAAGFLQPLAACGIMAVAVLVLRTQVLEPVGVRALVMLVIEIVVGAVAYTGAALVLCRATAKDLLSLVRRIARGKRAA